jgi:hypothetical protein
MLALLERAQAWIKFAVRYGNNNMPVRLLICCNLAAVLSLTAQIGAESQGGRLTSWTAVGIDNNMSKNWLSVTDFGYGRHSDPNNNQFYKRQGLIVITQDFIYKVGNHWSFSFSGGYWRRNAYTDLAPYDERTAPYQFRNELRPYQKTYYRFKINNIRVTQVFRTDYRFYWNQDFSGRWPTPFEFRARYRLNFKIPFTRDQQNLIVVDNEILSAVDKYSSAVKASTGQEFSAYQITENRFSLYYRRDFNHEKLIIDIGIMHQYWREAPGATHFNTSYNLMFDIILRDPFSFGDSPEKK